MPSKEAHLAAAKENQRAVVKNKVLGHWLRQVEKSAANLSGDDAFNSIA